MPEHLSLPVILLRDTVLFHLVETLDEAVAVAMRAA